jgi:thiol:disulfide interchange protein DsbD
MSAPVFGQRAGTDPAQAGIGPGRHGSARRIGDGGNPARAGRTGGPGARGHCPRSALTLGLRIHHQPGWHTYWKNAGDSGLATQLTWQLPAGITAGDIAWPMPQQIRVGDLLNYGYEGTVLLPVPATVAAGFAPDAQGMVRIQLQASWLVCRVECIPEDGSFTLDLPAQGSVAMAAADFAAAARQAPRPCKARPASPCCPAASACNCR